MGVNNKSISPINISQLFHWFHTFMSSLVRESCGHRSALRSVSELEAPPSLPMVVVVSAILGPLGGGAAGTSPREPSHQKRPFPVRDCSPACSSSKFGAVYCKFACNLTMQPCNHYAMQPCDHAAMHLMLSSYQRARRGDGEEKTTRRRRQRRWHYASR